MSIYLHGRAGARVWRYDFTRAGRRHVGPCLTPEGAPAATKTEARRAEERAKAAVAAPAKFAAPPPGQMTLAECLADYLRARPVRPGHYDPAPVNAAHLLRLIGPGALVSEIDADAARAYAARRGAESVVAWAGGRRPVDRARRDLWRETGRPISPATINRELSVLRAALYRVFRAGRIDRPPDIPDAPRAERAPTPIRAGDMPAILAAAAPHLADYLRLALLTGMRRAELLGLCPAECDLDAGVARLDARRTKAARAQTIFLAPEAVEILRDRQRDGAKLWQSATADADLRARLARRGIRRADQIPFLLYRHGRAAPPLPIVSLKRAWATALERAGLAGRYRLHDTRAAFATTLAEQGVGAHLIQDALRHASIRPSQRYVRVANPAVAAAAARAAQAITTHLPARKSPPQIPTTQKKRG